MTVIGFASAKGSPGVTLSTVLVGSWWSRPVVCVDADPDGGAMALRYGLPSRPGLLEFAAAGRHQRLADADSVWDFAQRSTDRSVPMVVSPDDPDQVSNALRSDGSALGEWCASRTDVDFLIDLGRLGAGSPSWSVAKWCDLVLLCAAPRVEQLQPAATRIRPLAATGVSTAWLLIGDGGYSDAEVVDAYGIAVTAHLPTDVRAAAAIDGLRSQRVLRRSPLVREGRRLAEALCAWSVTETVPETVPA